MPRIELLNCYIAKLLYCFKLARKQFNNSTIQQFNTGYTLIEFLVVLGILLLAGGSALLFLNSVLHGSNQANVVSEVKQNGQVVLDSLERQIRNARDVACVSSGGNIVTCDPATQYKHIKLTRTGNAPLFIKCFLDTEGGGKTENGWIGSAESTNVPTDSSFTPITNQDKISGTDIVNCDFRVSIASSGTSGPAVISISFRVNQGINAPSRAEFAANAQFQTTISLRRY